MNLGEAASYLARTLRLANSTSGTQSGNACRRHVISAIKELSATEFDFNVFDVDVSITGGLNDYTFGGSAGQALPAGALAPIKLYFYRSPCGWLLEKVHEHEMLEIMLEDTSEANDPRCWAWRNNAVRVYPVPTTGWALRGIWLRDGRIADATVVADAWTFPADTTQSIWLEGTALDVTINQAAVNYYIESSRPDMAQSHAAAVNSKRVPVARTSTRKRGKWYIQEWL